MQQPRLLPGRPLAAVIVTYGTLADPGASPHSRSALWPESWGQSVPMCAACWGDSRQVAVKYRPRLSIAAPPARRHAATIPGDDMTVPGTSAGGQLTADADDDAHCWREAARLRREHAGWVIIWLAPAGEYRAYRRLPGTRATPR